MPFPFNGTLQMEIREADFGENACLGQLCQRPQSHRQPPEPVDFPKQPFVVTQTVGEENLFLPSILLGSQVGPLKQTDTNRLAKGKKKKKNT